MSPSQDSQMYLSDTYRPTTNGFKTVRFSIPNHFIANIIIIFIIKQITASQNADNPSSSSNHRPTKSRTS